jgi:hypothetical protein
MKTTLELYQYVPMCMYLEGFHGYIQGQVYLGRYLGTYE